MEKYKISGMTCAACQSRIEKAVSKVSGVTSCSVNLLTNSMAIEGSADSNAIIRAVEKAGYGASLSSEILNKSDLQELRHRLIFSLIFLVLIMYINIGCMKFNILLPVWLIKNSFLIGLIQMFLTAVIISINRIFFINGFKSVIHGTPNMDTLVAMGSGISFIYSVVVLFSSSENNLYFESSAMILTLITVGKLLESVSKGKTTNALRNLIDLSPKKAIILLNGKEIEVPIDEVKEGTVFIIKPGMNIPVDGVVLEGTSAINEATLTGESIPVEKTPGSNVFAATTNTSGFLKCRTVKIGQDTTFSQIIKMVSDAASTKAPIAKIADKVSGIFVPSVIIISIITFITWISTGVEFSFALSKAISVLVVSCPCALGLATPVAIMVGNGVAAKNGILFKSSAALEATGKIQLIAIDKTGTITQGKPTVVQIMNNNFTEVNPLQKSDEELLLLKTANSLEKRSEHPLAKAIVAFAKQTECSEEEVEEWKSFGGMGVSGKINSEKFYAGNLNFIKNQTQLLNNQDFAEKLTAHIQILAQQGYTPIIVAKHNAFLGIISIADTIKPEAPKAISELKDMGIHVVMLTGDNSITAKSIAKQVGIDEVIAGVLPDEKDSAIKKLQNKGKVAMAGDGINDAPALTRANIGIAIGAGSDIAIEAADIVLLKNNLDDIPAAVRLSRKTLKNIHENLFWAFFYNIILIPIAAGVYYHTLGLQMNPMFGAAAMSLSSFCVVSNALRLNLFKIKDSKHDKSIKTNLMEINMERTIKVEGMMCTHCEEHVKQALEKIKAVESANPDYKTGEVKLILSKEVNDKELSKTITKAGYKFIF